MKLKVLILQLLFVFALMAGYVCFMAHEPVDGLEDEETIADYEAGARVSGGQGN